MKKLTLGLSLFVLIAISCKRDKIIIERFVWIQHNQNWIWNPEDLEARYYLELLDSCDKIRVAKTNIKQKVTNYFISPKPDSLTGLIIKNLYSKTFPTCFEDKDNLNIYDGDFYCIVYKFKDQPEQILNYLPFTIPDSLEKFTVYLEQLAHQSNYETTSPFDRTSLVNKYRNLIIKCGPLAPPPTPDGIEFKYIPPVVKDTL